MKISKSAQVQKNIKHSANIIAGVETLIGKKALKIVDHSVYLYPELWYKEEQAEAWMKNLYLYCRLKKLIPEGRLYFKDIETDEVLGFYDQNKAVVIADLQDKK